MRSGDRAGALSEDAPVPQNGRIGGGRLSRTTSLVAALFVALLPKCPACFLAYGGAFATLGWTFIPLARHASWLLPLACASLGVAVLGLWVQSRRTGQNASLLFCCAGAALLLVGRLLFDSALVTWAGLCTLTMSLLWAARKLGRLSPSPGDHHCDKLFSTNL